MDQEFFDHLISLIGLRRHCPRCSCTDPAVVSIDGFVANSAGVLVLGHCQQCDTEIVCAGMPVPESAQQPKSKKSLSPTPAQAAPQQRVASLTGQDVSRIAQAVTQFRGSDIRTLLADDSPDHR